MTNTPKAWPSAARLGMLTGLDLPLSCQVDQASNRIRGLFTQIHPALEKALGTRLEHDAVLEVLATWPTPDRLCTAGLARIDAKLEKHEARRHTAWTEKILNAPARQTMTVTGTDTAGILIPHLARQLIHLHNQRTVVTREVEEIVVNHPRQLVLTSVPRIALRTAAEIIAGLSGRTFTSAAALASYAGLDPTTRQSGTSIKSERVSHSGNKKLKRTLFLSAFATTRTDSISRTYHDRNHAQGKRHNQAIVAPAHRPITAIYAMLKDGTLYDPPKTTLTA